MYKERLQGLEKEIREKTEIIQTIRTSEELLSK